MSTTLAGIIPSPAPLISHYGTIGIILIIFAETGLLIGFFLPGDTLLFLAGAYTTTEVGSGDPHLNLAVLLPGVMIAAIAGAQLGHYIGRRAGPVLFDKPDSRIFKRKHVDRAHEVLHSYGEGKAIVLARFIPVVRTFMNPVCGVAEVPTMTFLRWNVVGGVLWSAGVTLLGVALGSTINIDKYILPIALVIVVLSAIPIILEVRKQRRAGAAGVVDDADVRGGGRHRSEYR